MSAKRPEAGEPPRKQQVQRRATDNDEDGHHEGVARWSELPSTALERVLAHLAAHDDVVSAGQTCRSWRAVAKLPLVWRHRACVYSTVYEMLSRMDLPLSRGLRHRDARPFVRIVRFAPCLGWLRTAEVMLPIARKALTHSSVEIAGVELNGRLVWPAKFLAQKEEGLKEVTLLNPNMACLLAALRCRDLRSFEIKFCRDDKYSCPVLSLDVPVERRTPLKGLMSSGATFPEAISRLVERFADSLEDLHVSCLPSSAALARCTRLKSLGVHLDPASEQDRRELLAGLRGKKLNYIGFKEAKMSDRHSRDACLAFRKLLQPFVLENVLCRICA